MTRVSSSKRFQFKSYGNNAWFCWLVVAANIIMTHDPQVPLRNVNIKLSSTSLVHSF